MIRTMLFLGALVTAVPGASARSGPALESAGAPDVVARTGKWIVDYNQTGCHLYAEFGTGPDQVIARFTRDQPGDAFEFSLFGARFEGVRSFTKGQLDFGLGQASEHFILAGHADKLASLLFRGTRLDAWKRVAFTDVPPVVAPEQEAKVDGVALTMAGKAPLRLQFGSLAKPLVQMRHCTAALVASWGYDPAEQASAQRPVAPATSPQTWISDKDYPLEQMRRNVSGIVRFRLGVAAEGSIESCQILAQTEPSSFGAQSCNLIRKRAKLEPALDAAGKPMRSYFVSSVSWLLP